MPSSVIVALVAAIAPVVWAAEQGALSADSQPAASAVVTIVRIAKPWYVPAFYVRAAFARAVPTYRQLPGLRYKMFTLSDDGRFGGIYLWRSRGDAEAWFNADWYARIKEKYGVDGEVAYYAVESVTDLRPASEQMRVVTDAGAVATVTLNAIVHKRDERRGLLREYSLVDGAGNRSEIALWTNREAAIAGSPQPDMLFAAPVLMPAATAPNQ